INSNSSEPSVLLSDDIVLIAKLKKGTIDPFTHQAAFIIIHVHTDFQYAFVLIDLFIITIVHANFAGIADTHLKSLLSKFTVTTKQKLREKITEFNGCSCQARTDDIMINSHALYRLS